MEVDHPTGQRGASTVADTDLTSIIGKLSSHLRLMVSLLSRIVSPSVEGKMMEKKGKATLEQAANMMVVVSYSSFKKTFLTFSSVMSPLIICPLSNAGRYGGGLGSPRLLEAP